MEPAPDGSAGLPKLKLLGLAPELVQHIVKRVDEADLASVRLATKGLEPYAARELFRTVSLSPAEEVIDHWNSITSDARLREIPRHATVYTQEGLEKRYGQWEEGDYAEPGEDFEEALGALSRLPNIDSLTIVFTPQCSGSEEDDWYGANESIDERERLLELIFTAVRARAAIAGNRTIHRLTIVHLQNATITTFTSSDLFRDVTTALDELHLEILQEYNEHGPDHDYTREELVTFPPHLVADWLAPVSQNLRALSLYNSTDNWGCFPGWFNPTHLSFPNLDTLALGYLTIAHDDQLDWVLAQKSLKRLILHNCMIVSYIRIYQDNMRAWQCRTHDWKPFVDPEGGERTGVGRYSYGGRWSYFLDKIADALPNLVDFRYDNHSTGDDPGYGVRNREVCSARMFPKRYIVFDNGILPTHWPEAEPEGVLYHWHRKPFPNLHEETLEADQRSLERLLETCIQRAGGR